MGLGAMVAWAIQGLFLSDMGVSGIQSAVSQGDAAAVAIGILGAFLGFLAIGVGTGMFQTQDVGRAIWTFIIMVAGGFIGATAVAATYVVIWTMSYPGQGIESTLTRFAREVAQGDPLFATLTAAGGVIGVILTGYVIGNDVTKKISRSLTGATIGALAGLVIFTVAHVVVESSSVPDSADVLFTIGQAVYSGSPLEMFFLAFGAGIGLLMGRYTWQFYGVVTLVSLISVVTGFLGYSFFVTLPEIDGGWRYFSIVLFVAEAASLVMVILYSFYTIDVATRKKWNKGPAEAEYSEFYVPKVAFQVPTFNEPPELVLASLERLRHVDYPKDRFHVMVLDDSTEEEYSAPLREFCEEHGMQYVHREERGGYKAGALNHSLQFTPDDVELLAVIDADYQVAPEYLKETVGYFVNPDLAWIQTPQDYRNRHQSFLTEQYYLADAYFYKTVMPSRNEENTIIFAGTMGILRRAALDEVGGWGEKYISEDAELSVRLLNNNWDSLYIDKSYGKGLIPATYEGYKKQHYRWAFGGAKILRGHFWKIFFGRLSRRQAFDVFVGSAHWFEGLFVLIISWVLIVLAAGEIFEFRVATHHSREILLIGLVPFFLLTDGITRLHMVMRERMRMSFGQTIRVLGMWFAVKFSNAFGALKSFVGFNIPFVRTPKAPDERIGRGQAVGRAAKAAPFETTMTLIILPLVVLLGVKIWMLVEAEGAGGLIRIFLWIWLTYYLLFYLAAPLYAYKSYVSFKPSHELEMDEPTTSVGGPRPS